MKKFYTYIHLLFLSANTTIHFGQSTIPFVHQLCYTESYVEKIKVTTQLNTASLSLQDKLRFTEKTFLKDHTEYLKKGKYPVHEVKYRAWTKIFPKWYRVADIIRTDETGVRSYFTSDNQYLPGGWSGHTYSSTENGIYSTGDGPGEGRYYHENHTGLSATAYQLHKESVAVFGLLAKHRFFYPTPQMLTILSKQGFTVVSTKQLIQISSPEIRITWKLTEKCIVREYLRQQNVIKTIMTRYKFVESIGQELKWTETEISPDFLENGDCIEVIGETTFCNYSLDCAGQTDFRTNDNEGQYEQVKIFPNPARDLMTVILPENDEAWTISIRSSSGTLVYSGSALSMLQIDVSQFASGLYMIIATQGTQTFSSKFIKL
jgi:hypothetical protein